MEISKKEKNEIINDTLTKFKDVNIITYEYIEEFLNSILNGTESYDGFPINTNDFIDATNSVMQIKYVIQNSIYTKLCRLSNDDIDILLFLVENKRDMANLVIKKLNADSSKTEDYLIEAINKFRGDESFNTYLTRYIMAKARNIPFTFKSDRVVKKEEVVEESAKRKKKKKKSDRKVQVKPTEVKIEPVIQESMSQALLEEPKVEIEDTKVEQAEKKEDVNPYLECIKRCNGNKGTGIKDQLVMVVQDINLVNIIDCQNNLLYEMFLFLRLGFINNSYYTREEIGNILGITILQVINYERDTWQLIRRIVDYKFNGYEEYILSKNIN